MHTHCKIVQRLVYMKSFCDVQKTQQNGKMYAEYDIHKGPKFGRNAKHTLPNFHTFKWTNTL
jgi:hypothetical protein